MHTGEIELRADGAISAGSPVNIGARIMGVASPGEVLVSRTVRDLASGSGVEFDARGTDSLKGVPDKWELLAVV